LTGAEVLSCHRLYPVGALYQGHSVISPLCQVNSLIKDVACAPFLDNRDTIFALDWWVVVWGTTLDDLQDLFRRYRGGDREALNQLLACLRRGGELGLRRENYGLSPHDCEEVLQEALSALWQSLPRFRGDSAGELRAFFRRTIHNKAIDFRRRRTARGYDRTGSHDDLDHAAASSINGSFHKSASSPHDVVEASMEEQRAIELLKGTLTATEFQVARLKVDGYKDREIAEILKIHIGSVAT
jgi:RNA polymerase sigma factor (sigma-70 family)